MQTTHRIGLTGGIAAGKSTVAAMLREKGAAVVDTDTIAHRVMAPAGPAYPAVVEAFGRDVLGPAGEIDRRRLGDLVFRDPEALERLNRAVHPHVRRAWRDEVARIEAAAGAAGADAAIVVVVIPLLYEVGAQDEFDAVVAVVCSESTAIERMRTRGLNEEQARRRLAAQLPMHEKAERADYVLFNDFDLPILADQADRLWRRLWNLPEVHVAAAAPYEE